MRFSSDDWNIEQIEARLRDQVCSRCIDRDESGACELRDRNACMLIEKLPQVIAVVLGTRSPQIGPYVASIHDTVCPRCENIRADGSCRLRETDECTLDLYLSAVVETVEEHFGRGTTPKLTHIQRALPDAPTDMGCWD